MINIFSSPATTAAQNTAQHVASSQNDAVLHMKKHDRMGGTVPVWENASEMKGTAKTQIENTLSLAARASDDPQGFSKALTYAQQGNRGRHIPLSEKPFGFGDLIDIVNPLHHIPVVGHIYRNVTGDEIRTSSKILGGAAFGGAAGAAVGLVDAVIKEETGKDMTQNAMGFMNGQNLKFRHQAHEPIPASMLRFASVREPVTEIQLTQVKPPRFNE